MAGTIPDAEVIGYVLKEQRKSLGLTQKQIAERAKIAERQYQTFENGERSLMTCSFQIACRVVMALDWDITGFFHGEFESAEYEEGISVPAKTLLRSRRQALGLKQKEVAERAGIRIEPYQKFEGGQRDLNKATFHKACCVIEALEMDITAFYLGRIENKREKTNG